MALPRYTTLIASTTTASPWAVASKASARSFPCHQDTTQPNKGAKQAPRSTWVAQGAALSFPS